MLSISEVVKISNYKHYLVFISLCKPIADLGCFRKTTAKVILKSSINGSLIIAYCMPFTIETVNYGNQDGSPQFDYPTVKISATFVITTLTVSS